MEYRSGFSYPYIHQHWHGVKLVTKIPLSDFHFSWKTTWRLQDLSLVHHFKFCILIHLFQAKLPKALVGGELERERAEGHFLCFLVLYLFPSSFSYFTSTFLIPLFSQRRNIFHIFHWQLLWVFSFLVSFSLFAYAKIWPFLAAGLVCSHRSPAACVGEMQRVWSAIYWACVRAAAVVHCSRAWQESRRVGMS